MRQGKQSVAIDNTNPTIEDRKRYIDFYKSVGFKMSGYYFQSNFEDCLWRNNQRQGKECIAEVGLRSVYAKIEIPQMYEGFDELYYVCMLGDSFEVNNWKEDSDG